MRKIESIFLFIGSLNTVHLVLQGYRIYSVTTDADSGSEDRSQGF